MTTDFKTILGRIDFEMTSPEAQKEIWNSDSKVMEKVEFLFNWCLENVNQVENAWSDEETFGPVSPEELKNAK